jgi:hypothetical protein
MEFEATVQRVEGSLVISIPDRIVEQTGTRPGKRIRVVLPGPVDEGKLQGGFTRGRRRRRDIDGPPPRKSEVLPAW